MIDIIRSENRGAADHGWLKSKHTFSFADYYNPQTGSSRARASAPTRTRTWRS
jgi:redox-sensitive bicupin YhaK (pirin superfamily)